MTNTTSTEDRTLNELIGLIDKEKLKMDLERIKRAYEFAKKAHAGQFRVSGVPYVIHPVEAAKILVSLGVDEDTIIAGILHDVPEDTDYTVEDIQKRFGKHVATLVDALTKLSKVYYKHSMGERQIQSLRKMFIETANDPRVVIIKLADRLHNMKTLQYLRPDKQQRIAKETLEIFAPLANLYGIYQLRRQLEDLCFQYLQPEEYSRIESFVHDHEKKRNHFINDTISILKKEMKKAGINAEFQGRPKHYYSIYQKTVRDKKVLQDIYDYFAIRVIVNDPDECYRALGIVHAVFKPKPKRFKDYIALPKPNGYQSLHTTVIGLRGKLTEIQIRTESMHRDAEYGAAAHIFYKDSSTNYISESIDQLKKYKNPENFIRGLQEDILQDRIFVFSPTGEIVNLPAGSTCLDYVFAAGLPVGKKHFRAIVNNKNYSLIGELQSGDHVEIVYGSKNLDGPERWWLNHVKTTRAKEQIQNHLRKKSWQSKIEIGMELLQQELDHENQELIYKLPTQKLDAATTHFNVENFEELLAQIGEGAVEPIDVYRIMFPELQVGSFMKLTRFFHEIKKRFKSEQENYLYRIRIYIEAYDRVGLLRELVQPFYDLNIPILKFKGIGTDTTNESPLSFLYYQKDINNTEKINKDSVDILIEDHEQLISLFDRLEKVPGVIRVQRAFRRNQVRFIIVSIITASYFLGHPFIIHYIQKSELYGRWFWSGILINAGILGMLALIFWLRSMGNKTFPHFEETKYFWPLSLLLSVMAICVLFIDDVVFGLGLNRPTMYGISAFILFTLYWSYRTHLKRRKRHLNRLKSSHDREAAKKI